MFDLNQFLAVAPKVEEKSEVANTPSNNLVEAPATVPNDVEVNNTTISNETVSEASQAVSEPVATDSPVITNEKDEVAEEAIETPNEDVTTTEDDPANIFASLSLKASKEDEKELKDEKKKGAAALKSKSTTKKDVTTKKEEDFSNVNVETVIRIGRDQLPLLDYFLVEEITQGIPNKVKDGEEQTYRKLTGEDVRARLEKSGFVEFVKDYTKMIYLEGNDRNFILPMTVAKVKGNIMPIQEDVLSAESTPSLLEATEKRIPFGLYQDFVNLAKHFSVYSLEVRGEFYYNYDLNSFHLHIPRQTVNEYWVEKNEPDDTFVTNMLIEKDQYCELVCEIHSHHSFAPYPSSTDNESERRPRMTYAIVGNITLDDEADMTARKFNLDETYTQLNLSDIFDTESPSYSAHNIDSDLLKGITYNFARQ